MKTSSFSEEKEAKRLSVPGVHPPAGVARSMDGSFLVLFFKKEQP
jgi:hypothetical protein